jgi:hypothetical protein
MSTLQRSSRVDWSFLSARGMRRCCGPLPKRQHRYPRKNSSTSTAPPGEARAVRYCFAWPPAAILIPRRPVYGDGKGVGESTETLSWHPRVVEPPGRGRVVSVPQVGGLHRRYARGVGRQGCMAKPGVMPGTESVCAGQEKTPPILPFTTPMDSDQRLRVCQRDAPGPEERFCRRIRPADDVFGTHRCQ